MVRLKFGEKISIGKTRVDSSIGSSMNYRRKGRLVGEEAGKEVLRAIPLLSQLVSHPITIAVR